MRQFATRARTATIVVAAIFLAVLSNVSAHSQTSAPSASSDTEGALTLYSSQPAGQTQIVVKAFEKTYSQIKVNVLQLTSGPLFSRFAGEVESGVHQADVFVTGSSAIYQKSPEFFRRLTKEEIPAIADLPKVVAPENEHYLIVGAGPFKSAYNTGLVTKRDIDEHLKSWKDLADPYWRNKIVTSDPRATTLYMSWFRTMRQTYGDEWLRAIAANKPAIVDGGSTAVQQVAAGAYHLAFPVALAHIMPIQKKGAPIDGFVPEGPVIAIVSSLAIAKDAPHPKAALLFAKWLMTFQTQSLLCPTTVPVLPGEAEGCSQLSPNHVGTVDVIPEVEQKQIMGLLGIKS
jgi:iron(III) transport system substrate-binding protein